MTESVWWYVLAGFLLGFILSTLWEWAYFRSRRLRIENRRIAELEARVRALTPVSGTAVGSLPPTADYQGPDVYLETELAPPAVEATAVQEMRIVQTIVQPEARPVQTVQPSPVQPARRGVVTSLRNSSGQPAPVQPTSGQPTSGQPTSGQPTSGQPSPINNLTVVIETQPKAETPPKAETQPTPIEPKPANPTVVIEQPKAETPPTPIEPMPANITVVVEQPKAEVQPESFHQYAAPPSQTTASANGQAPPLYDSSDRCDRPNGFVSATAFSTAAPETDRSQANRPQASKPESGAPVAEGEDRAAAATAGMVAVLAVTQVQEEIAPAVDGEQPDAKTVGFPALHSFLPTAAQAAEMSKNGVYPQTDDSAHTLKSAGIEQGIRRVESELTGFLASLKDLADATEPLLEAAPVEGEERLTLMGSLPNADAPEEIVTGPYAAGNLSRTEYAVVRLMQSARQVGRELRSLYRRG